MCTLRNSWNAVEDVVFVADDRVYFAQARHQGSRYNRDVGDEVALDKWSPELFACWPSLT